ncbi:diguanylate cyclase domain-containing protein, partial [Roseateles sp. 22389]|uniref:diguanylate cyclase domain-containing protein n=1 Tax=Roseateles sp. 22389 TaxID=3453916 RepID=UPI003F832681
THELELAKRNSTPLAVLFLDLNDFKKTNDQLGHEVGDRLLLHVAGVLKATLRASDTVCRIGGDEFVIIAENVPSDGVGRLISKIVAAVARPWTVAGTVLTQGVSIGASNFPADGDQAEDLVRKADAAMYLVKLAARTTTRGGERGGPMPSARLYGLR